MHTIAHHRKYLAHRMPVIGSYYGNRKTIRHIQQTHSEQSTHPTIRKNLKVPEGPPSPKTKRKNNHIQDRQTTTKNPEVRTVRTKSKSNTTEIREHTHVDKSESKHSRTQHPKIRQIRGL